jgi:hypothetical protein
LVVERFSQSIVASGILKLYIATGFFGTLIFFVLNSELFTPLEMIFSIVAVTIILKGIANIMLSLIISSFSLQNKKEELEFKHNSDKIDSALADLTIQEANNN